MAHQHYNASGHLVLINIYADISISDQSKSIDVVKLTQHNLSQ